MDDLDRDPLLTKRKGLNELLEPSHLAPLARRHDSYEPRNTPLATLAAAGVDRGA